MIRNLLIDKKDNKKIAIKHRNKAITFRQWHNASLNLSKTIKKQLNPGDKIIVMFENNILYCVSYFAVLYADCIVVPCYKDSMISEVCRIIKDLDIQMIITDCDKAQYLSKQPDFNYTIMSIDMSTISYNLTTTDEISCCNDDDKLSVILQSSGTSGKSKYVMLSSKNIISNIKAHLASVDVLEDDVGLIVLPMSFSYAHTSQFLSYLYAGITSILNDNAYFPTVFKKTIIDNGVTITNITPSILNNLFNDIDVDETIDKLRHICIGTAMLNTRLWEKAIKVIKKCKIYSTYGITEASPRLTTLPAQDFKRKIGSVGLAIEGVHIKVLPSNEGEKEGEICVKGNNVMLGYYGQINNPVNDGYLYTGDIGYIDSEGYLFIIGRKKNLIIKNGLNINPEEIENVLEQYPGIRCAYVFAQKDDYCGEVPIAHIEVNTPIQLYDVKQFCAERFAEYKIPSQILIVNKINRTLSGKIKRDNREENERI